MLSEQYFILFSLWAVLGWVRIQFEWYFRERTEVGKCTSSTEAKTLIIFTAVSLSIWVKILLYTAGWQVLNVWMVTHICALQLVFPCGLNREAS